MYLEFSNLHMHVWQEVKNAYSSHVYLQLVSVYSFHLYKTWKPTCLGFVDQVESINRLFGLNVVQLS